MSEIEAQLSLVGRRAAEDRGRSRCQLRWRDDVRGAQGITALDGSIGTRRSIVPAQLDGINASTDLVTVGIGGNDNGYTANVFSACLLEASKTPASCATFNEDLAPAMIRAVPKAVTAVFDGIRAEAPRARIVLVGYLRILPDAGSCSAIPIADSDLRRTAKTEAALDAAMRDTAESAGVDYVSMRSASVDHDACAKPDPWVSGIKAPPGDGAFLHPRLDGMKAVTTRLRAALTPS